MNLKQWQRSKKIKAEAEAAAKRTVKRVLNAVKEPAMSEFKVGDQIVKTNPNIKHAHIRTVIAITKSGGAVLDYSGYGYKAPRVRHATPEEIVAGHRIDDSVDQVFKEAVEHGHGFAMVSIEGVEQVSIAHVINPFPCEELGDDSHTESHISPLCKSKDV